MRTKVFGKFDALPLLLPELEVPISAACDDEVLLLGRQNVRDHVSVHVTPLIHLGRGQGIQVYVLMLQHLQAMRAGGQTKAAVSFSSIVM